MAKLSVIIPAYNEEKTITQVIDKIALLPIDKEIIVVDDGSSDNTYSVLRGIRHDLKIIRHATNRGKGAAFLSGLNNAQGEFVIIQDADMELDPGEYPKLLDGLTVKGADIVLGARFLEGHSGLMFHRMGNKFLTGLLNLLFHSRLNDYACCYKLARRETFVGLNINASGFDIDVELVCNALKKKLKILEVPVSYYPRSYKEGKKIRWVDGLWAIFYIFKYRFLR